MKQCKRLFALLLTVALFVSCTPGLTVETLAASQSVTVNNQAKLNAALKKQSIKKITVKTSKKVTLKTANKSYKGKTLSIKAKNVSFNNYSKFAKVNISDVNKYTEKTSSNILNVTDSKATITLGKDSKDTLVKLNKQNAKINLVANGASSIVKIGKKASVKVTGTPASTLKLVNSAQGSKLDVNVSGDVAVSLNKAANVVFGKNVKSATVSVTNSKECKITNNSDVEIIIASADGKETKLAPGKSTDDTGKSDSDKSSGSTGDTGFSGGGGSTGDSSSNNNNSNNTNKPDTKPEDKPVAKLYTVTFDSNGGSAVASVQQEEGKSIEEPIQPTKDNYTFSSWYTDSARTKAYDFDDRLYSDITLYAGWIENKPSYALTRSQWAGMLANILEFDLSSEAPESGFSYADIADDSNAIAIEIAHRYELFPNDLEDKQQDVPYFKPNEEVTREFMAYTVFKALGFTVGTDDVQCTDLNASSYPKEVGAVIKAGAMTVDADNKFSPKSKVSYVDVQYVIDKIAAWNSTTTLTAEDVHEYVDYAEDVSVQTKITDYEFTEADDVITVKADKSLFSDTIKEGEVIVLPEIEGKNAEVAVKVTSIATSGDNLVITGTKPEVAEVISQLDCAEIVSFTADDITPAEGVTVEQINTATTNSVNGASLYGRHGGQIHPTDLKFNFKLGDGIKITDSLKLKGSVKVEIPQITAIIDADASLRKGVTLNELTFSMSEEVTTLGTLEWVVAQTGESFVDGSHTPDFDAIFNRVNNKNFESGRFNLGTAHYIPIYGPVGAKIQFIANVNAKGEVKVSVVVSATEGVQYKNGQMRFPGDFTASLDTLELAGSASATVGVAVDLALFEVWDIIGVTLEAGPAFTASSTPHITSGDALYCINVSMYLLVKVTLDDQSLVGEIAKKKLHMTLEHEILGDKSNNPIRANLHLENCKKVDECTFGRGVINGVVLNSANNAAVKNAQINVYSDAGLVRTCFTDQEGKYSVTNLTSGTYKIEAIATGYKSSVIEQFTVLKDAHNVVPTIYLIGRTGGTGKAKITVVSAKTGEKLSGWNYKIKCTNNAYNLPDVEGTSTGTESLQILDSGNYSVEISLDGYVTETSSFVVSDVLTTDVQVIINPFNTTPDFDGDTSESIVDNFRVVLSWGEYPYDLDSHLLVSNGSSVVEHVYFDDQDGSVDGSVLNLDVDDTSSYGPETISVDGINKNMKYVYYVKDYSNRESDDSDQLSKSDATVKVYSGDKLLYVFTVPHDVIGTYWKVFEYDPSTDTLTPSTTVDNNNTYLGYDF